MSSSVMNTLEAGKRISSMRDETAVRVDLQLEVLVHRTIHGRSALFWTRGWERLTTIYSGSNIRIGDDEECIQCMIVFNCR